MERLTLSARVEAADLGRRTIRGRIVTWDEVGMTSAGPTLFEPGSIEVPATASEVRLLREHDHTAPLGRFTEFTEHDAGIDGVARVLATSAGDDALLEASEQLRDGLSVGVDVVRASTRDGIRIIHAARLIETSLVTAPAINSARVVDVAASETEPEPALDDDTPETSSAPAEETQETEPEMSETTEAVVAEGTGSVASAATYATGAVLTAARTTPRLPSAGEYIAAALKGGEDFERITAAVAEQKIADNPGLIPQPIVGPVIDTLLADRPVVNAVRRLAMPATGKKYDRPVVTQHTAVGKQSAEFAELTSQKMIVQKIECEKETYGGSLLLSVQDRDFTDPAILQMIVDDMVRVYADETDNAAADALVAATTQQVNLAANAASDVVIKALYDAAALVNAGVNRLPDTLFASPDQWARLGSLVDSSKRPIFPSLAPSNAGGTLNVASFNGNPLGLNLVVDSNFADGTLIVARSEYFEVHEQAGGQMSVAKPSNLAIELAFYGYFEAIATQSSALVKLAPAA